MFCEAMLPYARHLRNCSPQGTATPKVACIWEVSLLDHEAMVKGKGAREGEQKAVAALAAMKPHQQNQAMQEGRRETP